MGWERVWDEKIYRFECWGSHSTNVLAGNLVDGLPPAGTRWVLWASGYLCPDPQKLELEWQLDSTVPERSVKLWLVYSCFYWADHHRDLLMKRWNLSGCEMWCRDQEIVISWKFEKLFQHDWESLWKCEDVDEPGKHMNFSVFVAFYDSSGWRDGSQLTARSCWGTPWVFGPAPIYHLDPWKLKIE